MKAASSLSALLIAAALGLYAHPARACDFDFVNGTSSPVGQLRLYNHANRFLGVGEAGPLLKSERFRFSQRRMRYGTAAWPDSCEDTVYIDMVVGRPGARTIEMFGGEHCHVKKQIRLPVNATLDVNNRPLVIVTPRDLIGPGVCQDR